jgi:hypothetical protein
MVVPFSLSYMLSEIARVDLETQPVKEIQPEATAA